MCDFLRDKMEIKKIQSLFEQLNGIREQILSLSEDIFLGIDPRDNVSLQKGLAFILDFNVEADKFSEQVSKIEELLLGYFDKTSQEMQPAVEQGNGKVMNERLIRELDRNKAYSLYENFTYKRPFGFVLQGIAYKNLMTWKAVYLKVLSILYQNDPAKFDGITTAPSLFSKRGNPFFSMNPDDLRVAEKIANGVYAELNLSANNIKANLIEVLKYFDIDPSEMKVYLREDRDA